jgi:hypothetical protein
MHRAFPEGKPVTLDVPAPTERSAQQ